MSDLKNIVVIGASSAGVALANALSPQLPGTHRIILIDALGFSFWSLAALRAAVVPGWEQRVTAPLTQEAIFAKGAQHQLISRNKVVELRENSLVLEHPFEGSTEVSFVKAVIATGAQQPPPMRPLPGSTEEEYKNTLVKFQQDIGKATKIVVVGGGSVGLELVGDIRERYPEVSITIVHSLANVLNPSSKPLDSTTDHFSYSNPPTALKLSTTIEGILKDLKIDLVLNDRVQIPADAPSERDSAEWDGSAGLQSGLKSVKLASGKTIEADFVFVSTGNKPNVSLVEAVDKGAIAGGLVAVDKYLKVVSKSTESVLTKNYYAIGDCASSPGWKNAQGAGTEATGAAANILAEIRGKPIKPYARPKPYGMVIPLGTKRGAGTLEVPLLGTVSLPEFMVKSVKGKRLFVEELFVSRFQGSQKPTIPGVPAL